MIRRNPADPVKGRQSLEEVARDPIPAERAEERVCKEPFTGYASTCAHAGVYVRVQRIEKCTGDKIRGPDHRWRIHQKSACDAPNREADLEGDL